jgi:perosamine synthetase
MMDKKKKQDVIPSAGGSITDDEIQLVTEAIKFGWYENRNMHLDKFLNEFSDYIGIEYCLPVVNCTSAIHLALLALNIGKGDEVIVPDITWVASVAPIHYVGATPVFVDIDEANWCVSPESFESAITSRTKAVIIVDLYGKMPDMDKLLEIAKNHNIKVIEDAAEAIGATYNNKKAGTFGDIGVFSFNATKLMMAGQGGMLVTRNIELFNKAKQLAHHGMLKYTDKTTFWSIEIGYNYQWTNIQAALALAQFRRLNELVEHRRRIFHWYEECLDDIGGITLNNEDDNVFNTYWVVTAIVNPKYNKTKEDILRLFTEYNIDSRPFFYPISSMPAYSSYTEGKDMMKINPVSYRISPYGISFPSFGKMTRDHVSYVCESFKNILQSK